MIYSEDFDRDRDTSVADLNSIYMKLKRKPVSDITSTTEPTNSEIMRRVEDMFQEIKTYLREILEQNLTSRQL